MCLDCGARFDSNRQEFQNRSESESGEGHCPKCHSANISTMYNLNPENHPKVKAGLENFENWTQLKKNLNMSRTNIYKILENHKKFPYKTGRENKFLKRSLKQIHGILSDLSDLQHQEEAEALEALQN